MPRGSEVVSSTPVAEWFRCEWSRRRPGAGRMQGNRHRRLPVRGELDVVCVELAYAVLVGVHAPNVSKLTRTLGVEQLFRASVSARHLNVEDSTPR